MATKAKRSKSNGKKRAENKTSANKTAAKNGSNGGSIIRWSSADDKTLKTLIKQNTPTPIIGLKLKRTEGSVRQHAYKLGLSLKPTNRSPYG
jgi:hypothetical protein